MSHITIAGRKVGDGEPCFIVAELSGNHNQSYDNAVRLVHVARAGGADAVKGQCYTPDSMTIDCDKPPFMIDWLDEPRTLYDLYRQAATPMDWHPKLKALAESLGMIYFATAFDCAGVDFLESIGVPCHKAASFELVDLPLICHMAKTGKPLILSTGMATYAEIDEALEAASESKPSNDFVALLHCTSAYPAPTADSNLWLMQEKGLNFACNYGLSDHTLGIAVPVAAVACGACIIEKHLCLDRSLGGPDSAFSLEPAEFKQMVTAVRTVEAALGEVHYGPTESEKPMLRYRRSLWVVQDVKADELFTVENVRSIRPSGGLHPRHYGEVMGRKANRDIERGTALAWDLTE